MTIDFSALTAASATPVTSTTSSTSTTSGTSATATTDTGVGSQDYFLKLLVAQMNNQDPLNPMDSAQMTSQLAQLNTVQGIKKLSTQLDSLLGDVNASQSLQASSLVGHSVLVPGSTLELASGQAVAGFNLSADADDVKVTIKDASGTVIHTADLGKQSAGIENFVWDGSTDSGSAAAAGAYTFSVTRDHRRQGRLGGHAVDRRRLQRHAGQQRRVRVRQRHRHRRDGPGQADLLIHGTVASDENVRAAARTPARSIRWLSSKDYPDFRPRPRTWT